MLAGCGAALPRASVTASVPEALALLGAALAAHGGDAYMRLNDVNISFDGEWYPTVKRVQPTLTDPDFRKTSEERLMPATGVTGQQHRGPRGVKQVFRTPRAVSVWYNGEPEKDAEKNSAAAAVPDGYQLFMLGPIFAAARLATAEITGVATLDGRVCDLLLVVMRPGMGFGGEDRALFWIDRVERLMRRVRFTLEGFSGTRGAVVDVDVFDYIRHYGVQWPTRYFEQVRSPLPLKVHRWWLTGLDINRGYTEAAIAGPRFQGLAAAPARPLVGEPRRMENIF